MTNVNFVKSFSKGQITIPKDIRKTLGVGDDFWLKLSIENGKIVGEPVEEQNKKKLSREEYIKKLLAIRGDWFDQQEFERNRKRDEARSKRIQKQLDSALSARVDA